MLWQAILNPGTRRKRRHKRGCACVICVSRRARLGVKKRRATVRGRRLASAFKRVARRWGGGRRHLSAWQRMVKKYGGVMQAVRAKRKLKRRSAGSRRGVSRRGRSRRFGRRSTMARVARRRRRRSPPRGRGGRFVSRRGRRRRARRNSWFGASRKHARAARKGWRRRRHYRNNMSANPPRRRRRRNPWATITYPRHRVRRWRGRRGRFTRRNAVVPVSWNPRRRRYRRNAVLPFSLNPGGAIGDVIGQARKFIDVSFWTNTAVPAAGGFLGSKVVGGVICGVVEPHLVNILGIKAAPLIRIGCNALGATVLAWGVRKFLKNPRMADAVFLGGVVSVAHAVLKEVLGGTDIGRAIGLDGLGADVTSAMQEAVARRMQAELSGYGVGTYLNQTDLQRQSLSGVGEFVTDVGLRRQPSYAPSPSGDLRDYDVARTETAI